MSFMDRRVQLHNKLVQSGVSCCYFQPPDNTKLTYPAIVYKRKAGRINSADNANYKYNALYEIKVLDANPDTPLVEWMFNNIEGINYVNHYTSNGVNVEVFNLYW